MRATGGLADTVFDVDDASPPPEGQHPNGFTFAGADEDSEDGALNRAFRYGFCCLEFQQSPPQEKHRVSDDDGCASPPGGPQLKEDQLAGAPLQSQPTVDAFAPACALAACMHDWKSHTTSST